jgi:hypothetical protein
VKGAAAVLAIAIGVVVILIGRDGDAPSAQAAVNHALARTVDAHSSRFTITAMPLPDQFAYDYTLHGIMDYVHHRGRMTYGLDDEMILDGDVTYARWPMPWRHDSAWLRMETDSQETDPLDLYERAITNPMGLLSFLTGASNDARTVGSESVRGTRTKHYEGTLDLQKVVDQAPPDKRAELREWLDFIREDQPTIVPFGLWVDSDGIARRLRIDGSEGAGSVVIEYYDFGVPVEITPPPASEILSTEEFFKEMERHAADSNCSEEEPSSDEAPSADAGEFQPDGQAGTSNGGVSICLYETTATLTESPNP